MASDLKRELLASDNEASASTSTQSGVLLPSTPAFTSGYTPVWQLFPSSAIDPSGTQQLFLQFVQILDNKLDHKLTSFKRKFDEKEDLHASQLKKLKLKLKATNLFKLKGNKIQHEFNVASIDCLEKVSKYLLGGDLSKANAELEQQILLIQKRNKLIRFADKSPGG